MIFGIIQDLVNGGKGHNVIVFQVTFTLVQPETVYNTLLQIN
jgi:hypothetical protein